MNPQKQPQPKVNASQSMQKTPVKASQKVVPASSDGYSNKKKPVNPQNMPNIPMSMPSAMESHNDMDFNDIKYVDGDYGEGESIRVCVRVRPMNKMELNRGDENCSKVLNDTTCQIMQKGAIKHYAFNTCLSERTAQGDVFNKCGVHQLLDSVLDGYSATILAYGQTGSGKTYTMAGVEEKLGQEVYISDETEGIIPRAFRYLWQSMIKREEQFYVKASYMEIYNEQIRDLLNPSSGVLHTRWNVKNGFFVEDLLVVECAGVEDLVAVLHEGMKNRRKGSHELNQDSSRSHSILTVYLISEVTTQGQPIRKYGKMSFVDLAGSERLKESKSNGDMIKETGNINKSLFTLGKVISGLSDKKNKNPYIPYRDSKLTMLLMDSIGGNAKSLMIACMNPSMVYIEETMSTLNYATRTMNIKNKPVLQVDAKEQVVMDLTRENQLLKMENQYLREQLQRATNGLPIDMPDFMNMQKNGRLPPLSSGQRNPSSSKKMIPGQPDSRNESRDYQMDLPVNKILSEYNFELNRLKKDNEELRHARDLAEKNYHILMNDNNALNIKLENLENVFIGNPLMKGEGQPKNRTKMEDEFMISNLMTENTDLKNRIKELEEKNMHLAALAKERNLAQELTNMPNPASISEVSQLRQNNGKLQERVEYLQQRERELLGSVNRFQKPGGMY